MESGVCPVISALRFISHLAKYHESGSTGAESHPETAEKSRKVPGFFSSFGISVPYAIDVIIKDYRIMRWNGGKYVLKL